MTQVNGRKYKPREEIKGLEVVGGTARINGTKDERDSVLGGLFDDSFEKRRTQVERNMVYPPHPYARLGDLSDETVDPASLFDKQKDVDVVWNKCTLIQTALNQREYGKLDEIIAGNETDPQEIETKKQELPNFILLAHLGYCISVKYLFEKNGRTVPVALEEEIKDARALVYEFAMAATQGNISDKTVKEDLDKSFYSAIDYVSELFAERFAEDGIDSQGTGRVSLFNAVTEGVSFFNAMTDSRMRKFLQMMFMTYSAQDKKLLSFEEDLDIANRLKRLFKNMLVDSDYYGRQADDWQNHYFNGNSPDKKVKKIIRKVVKRKKPKKKLRKVRLKKK